MTRHQASLDHLNLTVRNFGETQNWYKELFGFEIVEKGLSDDGSPWGVLRSGDSMLCIHEHADLKKIPENGELKSEFHRIYHFALRITDRTKWEHALVSKNIRTYYGGAVSYPHSISWYVRDPSGHMIEVVIWNDDEVEFD